MTPEARSYLDEAGTDIEDARKVLGLPLPRIAARCAYYAMFHAAEALIFEDTGKIAKTHSGVRSEFARLVHARQNDEPPFATWLKEAYKYKELCDYGVGKDKVISLEIATELIEQAVVFIDHITSVLGIQA